MMKTTTKVFKELTQLQNERIEAEWKSLPHRLYESTGWEMLAKSLQDPPSRTRGQNYSFSATFLVPKVAEGQKCQTVRPLTNQHGIFSEYRLKIDENSVCHLYFHLRQPDCYKIGDGDALGTPPVLSFFDFTDEIALADGFTPYRDMTPLQCMQDWFKGQYGSDRAMSQPYALIAWVPSWDINEPFPFTTTERIRTKSQSCLTNWTREELKNAVK